MGLKAKALRYTFNIFFLLYIVDWITRMERRKGQNLRDEEMEPFHCSSIYWNVSIPYNILHGLTGRAIGGVYDKSMPYISNTSTCHSNLRFVSESKKFYMFYISIYFCSLSSARTAAPSDDDKRRTTNDVRRKRIYKWISFVKGYKFLLKTEESSKWYRWYAICFNAAIVIYYRWSIFFFFF